MTALTGVVRMPRQLGLMRLVTVAAGDAVRVHAALQKRSVLVDLTVNLSVVEIESFVEQRRTVAVGERAAGVDLVGQLGPSGVTARAHLDLYMRRTRLIAVPDA